MLIDTHAHLTHSQLLQQIDDYLQRAEQAGVTGILSVGTTLADSRQCVDLAQRFPIIRAAVGLHPNNCSQAEPDDWDQIVALADQGAASGLVVAVGETGLDRYWDDSPWALQLDYLRRHVELGRRTGLPLVIHTRDCGDEALEILRREHQAGAFAAVMHSFTGTLEQALGYLELGFYISFAGMVTFKNSADLRAVARQVPEDRLLIETDSPYLTPHPYRGQRPNHPALVRHTLESLAELRGVASADLASQTSLNAQRLFKAWGTENRPQPPGSGREA